MFGRLKNQGLKKEGFHCKLIWLNFKLAWGQNARGVSVVCCQAHKTGLLHKTGLKVLCTLHVHTNHLLVWTFPSNCTMYMRDVHVHFLLGWKMFPLWVIISSGWFWRFQSVFPLRWFHACSSQRVRRWSMYLSQESHNGPSSPSTVIICYKVVVCRRHGWCVPASGFSEIG